MDSYDPTDRARSTPPVFRGEPDLRVTDSPKRRAPSDRRTILLGATLSATLASALTFGLLGLAPSGHATAGTGEASATGANDRGQRRVG